MGVDLSDDVEVFIGLPVGVPVRVGVSDDV